MNENCSLSIVVMKMTIETRKREVCDLHGLMLMSFYSQSKNRNYERMVFVFHSSVSIIGDQILGVFDFGEMLNIF
jgi:hypothetical protein